MMLKRIMRYGSLFAAVVIVCLVFLTSCKAGGERGREPSTIAPVSASAAAAPRAVTLDEALAELEALARPPGVDPALWQRLKDRLRDVLTSRQSAKGVSVAPLEDQEGDRGDDRNTVADLDYLKPQSQRAIGMEFRYRNLGDYDQDGIVAIADVTPLAA